MVEHEICLLTWAISYIGRENIWNGECINIDYALVLGNLCEYRHNWFPYILHVDSLDYTFFVADSIGLASLTLT